MDGETIASEKARLLITDLKEMAVEQSIIDYGAIILCKSGTATMRIDFKDWRLHSGNVIALFPNDVVSLYEVSSDFKVEMLRYDKAMLREASLQLERTVYSMLRKDRCRTDRKEVTSIIEAMFNLLYIYFQQDDCKCIDQLVLYQLKAFFIGFYDWISRNKEKQEGTKGTRRVNELINQFMENLEQFYRQSHDVAFYAARLNITPKYLNTIVKRMTGHTAKTVIDHYLILQLKLLLRSSDMSVKQLAWEFKFCDASFFCRYFKLHTGFTPQQFRLSIKMR